ncbi:hypothetical protein Pryu01_00556 [Paraliobacillus ryukyuensis]|uniref:LysM domain-containing protein n=1 Tax=Paraliobacillus ryukyuensis TaxID=200904 RepID=A0A366EGC2_9BACI|nr:hypothetical protein [Paraliobacillus ryukyuensis]RBP01378.1 hypothetical protein DES48_101108 [Paraliobacillus ryukyuensis]
MIVSKKIILCFLLFLLLYSVIVDLTNNSSMNEPLTGELSETKNQISFNVVSYQMKEQDTFISVIDQLNPNLTEYDLTKVRNDFIQLNPSIHPSNLKTKVTYLFPQYN